ncbi:MAG: DUF2125 domain-containing protein [Parvibaculaceae bacterium]
MSRLPEKIRHVRWSLIAPFLVLAVLAGLYSIWWVNLAGRIETALLDWQQEQAGRGVSATWQKLETGGFPYRLQLAITEPEIGLTETPDAWRWTADRLVAQMLPYKLGHIIIDAPGPQTVHYTDGRAEGPQHFAVHLDAETFWASLVDEDDDSRRIAIDIAAIVANRERLSDSGSELAGSAAATRLQLHARPSPGSEENSFDAAFRGEDISWTVPGDAPWPGTTITRLDAQARLSDLPDGLPRSLETFLPAAAARGTKLTFSEFTLVWGPIDMKGLGEMTLDAKGRPEGQFRTSVGNLDALIDALVRADIVSRQSATLAFAGLTALSNLQGEEHGRVRLPVAMREGVLFLGPIAAARLQPLY